MRGFALIGLCSALACGTGLVDAAGAGPALLPDGGSQDDGGSCATCVSPIRATAVSAGGDHSCAVVGGGVKCWGANDQQQLGSSAPAGFSATPVDVPGVAGASLVASGADQSCALLAGGAVKCWGKGAGVAEIAGLSGAVHLAVGARHACASTPSAIFCWGANDSGQLGDDSDAAGHPQAVAVGGLGGATALGLGLRHSCALVGTSVHCWGAGDRGQLGDDSTDRQPRPVQVSSSAAFSGLGSGENHACAIQSGGGAVQCWGANDQGQISPGGRDLLKPGGLSGGGLRAQAIAGGGGFTCAIDQGGALSCLGASDSGQRAVGGVSGLKKLALGGSHGCAIFADDGVKCWGKNDKGQLGSGTTSAFSAEPQVVSSR